MSFQANIRELSVEIPNKLHNSIIGAKGRLIRSIMEECGGVIIRFPQEGTSDKVTIRGPKDDVEKARKQLLELANEKVQCIHHCTSRLDNNQKGTAIDMRVCPCRKSLATPWRFMPNQNTIAS